MQTLFQDLAYGWRMLRKSSGVTAVILIMLMLGIGANTTVFTIFDAILLRPLTLEKPQELIQLWESSVQGAFQQMPFSYPDYQDMKQQNKAFSSMGGYSNDSVTLSGRGETEQVAVGIATTDFFETLGVRPVLGRTFRAEEDRDAKNILVLITFGAWQRRFAGDPHVIGKVLAVDGDPATVVGVLPQNFSFAPTNSADLWISARIADWRLRRNAHWLFPVARLKPGLSLQQAQSEVSALAAQLAKQYPDSNAGVTSRVIGLRQQIVGQIQPVLVAVMGGIGFVLLITCANVAGLLLARSLPRKREIAMRQALGAGSLRIARQLLTESVLLAIIGGLAAAGAAYWAVPALVGVLPQAILLATPQLQDLTIDATVLWFVLGLSLSTGILFGLAPVLQTFRPGLQRELQEAGRGSIGSAGHLRNVLVISEMAFAVILLVGAGLMLKSLNRVLHIDPGFDTNNLLTGSVVLPQKKYPDGPKQLAFLQQLIQNTKVLPGVQQAAAVSIVPLSGGANTSNFDVEGHPKAAGGKEYEASTPTVTQNYFSTMRIPLRAGRFFNSQDTDKSPHVVVVNQMLADLVFPHQDPVGKRLNFTYTNIPNYVRIVGVVGNENVNSLDAPITPIIYSCYEQDPSPYSSLVIRTNKEPTRLTSAVSHAIHQLEPEAAVYKMSSMAEIISTSPTMMLRGYPAYLIGGFAALALLLATLGLYGVLAYNVTQRTRELGLRMALGAQRNDLLRMVVNNGLKLAAIGICLGTAGGLAVARLIANLLFGVAPTDVPTFMGVGMLLLIAAVAASYVPALRATTIDPMVALRYE